MEKKLKKDKLKIAQGKISELSADHCFSIIFDPRAREQSLDLVADDPKVVLKWTRALTKIIQAMKSVEMQKEHECYLRSQFQSADKKSSGYLLLHEFAELLR